MLSSTYFTPICIFPPQVLRFGHVYMYIMHNKKYLKIHVPVQLSSHAEIIHL